jgi:hypothetical protein
MTSLSKIAAGFAFGLVLIGTLPAQAASHAGLQSRAQASTQSIGHEFQISPKRARALRDCNDRVKGFPEHTYGNHKLFVYRACMAGYGEVE